MLLQSSKFDIYCLSKVLIIALLGKKLNLGIASYVIVIFVWFLGIFATKNVPFIFTRECCNDRVVFRFFIKHFICFKEVIHFMKEKQLVSANIFCKMIGSGYVRVSLLGYHPWTSFFLGTLVVDQHIVCLFLGIFVALIRFFFGLNVWQMDSF